MIAYLFLALALIGLACLVIALAPAKAPSGSSRTSPTGAACVV
ncbi:hypothetical protein AB0M87_04725 [Streptomyces sp. NPDC051320]